MFHRHKHCLTKLAVNQDFFLIFDYQALFSHEEKKVRIIQRKVCANMYISQILKDKKKRLPFVESDNT